ncbi:MAG: Flp family type IVb pilin [Microthrixaceae bacterium]
MGSQPSSADDRRRRDERGASLVEYALLIALIAIVLFSAVTLLGETTRDALDDANESIAVAKG